MQSCKEQKIMRTLESDRGDQQSHESVVAVHGVRASTIWRNQNKHCSIFGRGRLASIVLPGQDEMQQMGRSWGGKGTQRWEIKPHGPWQSTRKQRKLKLNCTTGAASPNTCTFWRHAPSQCSSAQWHKGPDSKGQWLHVAHTTCWEL